MTAEQILAGMVDVYAGCQSYCDTGVVRTRFLGQPDLSELESGQPFRTAFVRPDRFRFEFSSTHPGKAAPYKYIVHGAGEVVQTWWDVRPGVERHPSLGLALAGATGISGGAAHTVPALLLSETVGGQRLTGLGELTCLDDGDLGGVGCYRVQGRPPAAAGPMAEDARRMFREMTGMNPPTEFEPVVLWVDKRTQLLRQVERRHRLPFGESVQVATYEPALNAPVPDGELAFDAPIG